MITFCYLVKSTTQGVGKIGDNLGPPTIQDEGQVTFVNLKGGN